MFEGLSVALVTPFRDGALDEPATERLVDFVSSGGTDVLVVAGSTGEAATCTREERRRLYALVKAANGGRAPPRRRHRHERHRRHDRAHEEAARRGLDGAMIVVPYYNKPTPAGQVAHFTAVAKAVELPLVALQRARPDRRRTCCPRRSCASRDPEHRRDQGSLGLARPGERDPRALRPHDALGRRLAHAAHARGGRPRRRLGRRQRRAARAHATCSPRSPRAGWLEAEAIHLQLLPLMRALFLESNPWPGRSRLLADMGLVANELRLPLVPVEPATAAAVREAAHAAGIVLPVPTGAAR